MGKMKITAQILKILVLSILLFSVIMTLRQPHKALYNAKEEYIVAYGNAADSVRKEVLQQLRAFQDGYTQRDKNQVDSFMERMFSKANILVLGTMPDEIYIGHKEVSKLVYSDWNAWGDCTFLVNNTHISTTGDVAWITTIGYVKFDLPRLLVLPLRLTAVMVKEGPTWKFQFMQYQFDLNLFPLFLTIILLTLWLTVSLVNLAIMTVNKLGVHTAQ
jgi:hypothetical protein